MPRTAYALAALALLASPVSAQSGRMCLPEAQDMVNRLSVEFGETLTAAGVDGGGNLVQVYSAPSGSWTIVVTVPAGPTCIVSSGEGFVIETPATEPVKPRGRVS